MLNIYVTAGSYINNSVHYTNAKSIIGTNITWTQDTANNCSYNAQYNIRIYPVANVEAARIANGD